MWDTDAAQDASAERSFLGRIGQPEECAGVVRARASHCVCVCVFAGVLGVMVLSMACNGMHGMVAWCVNNYVVLLPAPQVAFLCSTDASYITGETLPVCGGSEARL